MGKYTNAAAVKANYKRFNSNASIEEPKVESFITYVESIIDGVLYKIYAIPLVDESNVPSIPEIIKSIAIEMSTARCLKYFFDSNQLTENEVVRNMWLDHFELLKSYVENPPDMLLPCKFRAGVRMADNGKFEFNQQLETASSSIWSTGMDAANQGMQPIFDLDDWPDSQVNREKLSDINRS
ncbi:MAG TPA: hypothetical protein PKK26_03820 [Candidatus Wallbacteria bacterium]|nr:hypothetical protein [Candidatus Wallbacteria bacterium]